MNLTLIFQETSNNRHHANMNSIYAGLNINNFLSIRCKGCLTRAAFFYLSAERNIIDNKKQLIFVKDIYTTNNNT